MTLRTRLASVLVAASLAGTGLVESAAAGTRTEWPVQIDFRAMKAWGSFSSARNSADSVQVIECSLVAEAGSPLIVSCTARDANGNLANCGSQDPGFVTIVAALNLDDVLVFQWDKSHICTRLDVLKSATLQT